MMIAAVLMALFLVTLLCAVRTLLGMRHRMWYPLFRYRRADGTSRPVAIRLLTQGDTL